MPGTRQGGLKTAAKLLEKDPDFYKKQGVKGGKKSRGGGFTDRELARRAGAIGGRVSRRKRA